ncbi:CRISPR-associated endonuclease Csn1 [Dysgonomonadaceae bacterium PH5-43]|nr:CRISPR-associated endonuclease Csn1 [Dysgonomonadaceae bacterium PH5-43]
MKKIFGLDLGVASIGFAVVNEAETQEEKSSIVKLGVRVNPLTVDETTNFEKGKSITTNADRTLKRGARRNLQRYKLRRLNLIKILKNEGFITDETVLTENGNKTTFETYRLRAKAATEKISLEEFARVLLMINKKRGYKSSRKAKSQDEGQLIDGMEIAKKLYDENLTPGQFVLQLLKYNKKYIPDFYRSDLQNEFDRIWYFQKQFYPYIFTDELKENLRGKNEKQTWAICEKPFGIVGLKRNSKGAELNLENYEWRAKSLCQKMDLEELVIVFQKINIQLGKSSGYLGNISDRSKELHFYKQTVGQYLMAQLDKDPNIRLKNLVFYRQDYLNEFEIIWETQAKFYKELTEELKQEIRDVIIFYQRKLKSQKGLISFCEFERKNIEIYVEGKKKTKTVGLRVCPRSSPLFQEFKIWQKLNDIEVFPKGKKSKKQKGMGLFDEIEDPITYGGRRRLYQEEKEILARELSVKKELKKSDILKILFKNHTDLDLNFTSIQGNLTQTALFDAYQKIIDISGHGEYDFSKLTYEKIIHIVSDIFAGLGYNTDILYFNSSLSGEEFEQQALYKLWHLLYSFEGDDSTVGNEKLINKITELYGFDKEYASVLANIVFQDDYGSLSAKAIKKILPYMKDGNQYNVACEYAGYRHSEKSLTKDEIENKVLKDKLDILPKNSLRNPVVEKILNQMVNVINTLIDKYGKPDEIRIELARELKKNAKERADMTVAINNATAEHEKYREILKSEKFGLSHISRNDIIRYKLYEELKNNGYKTLYSNRYISPNQLFSKEIDIEHIIPQASSFDDSFANKTLEFREVNLKKGNKTASDFVLEEYGEQGFEEYLQRIETLFGADITKKTKLRKLKMAASEIKDGFIARDLRDTQYIAKKAKEILEELVKTVVSTTGMITDRLREDWQLIDVMKELNWDKYEQLGLTEVIEGREGQRIYRIKDWTKRNDHRHHAMDALTVAFTKHSHIQYLNNLNARKDKTSDIYGIERKELYRDNRNKLKFTPPIYPVEEFRSEAKKHLEDVLISIKAKNKVFTNNINKSKKKGGVNKKQQSTPRGQLHNETIYGSCKRYVTKMEKVGAGFNEEQIRKVANKKCRDALLKRLQEFNNDAKKAFTGKNSLAKNPIYIDAQQTISIPEKVKTVSFETIYTIRKEVSPDLKVEKVVDLKIRKLLEDRLKAFGGNAKQAFSNLEENPIWLNEAKGIKIKRVAILGISNAQALHDKKDNKGQFILDENAHKQPVDFVNTGNNHHVAIYRDENGNLQENVVSFFEVTSRSKSGVPIIDKDYKKDEGWQFLFTMKQNEYFVFPNDKIGFDPKTEDLLNPDNYAMISPNLFRVQKFTYKNYVFRHHLETTVNETSAMLKRITWTDFRSSRGLDNIVKVRINHIGEIVAVGEY